MKKIYNFSAGPAVLPREAIQAGSEAVLDFDGMGMSLIEISHRSKQFQAVMDDAVGLVRKLFSVSDDYEVLFLQGGASLQFAMVPFNLLTEGGTATYLDTGSWSAKAIKEAQKLGNIQVAASSKSDNYTWIPKDFEVPAESAFLHVTSNNTIYGTQFKSFPEVKCPLVADMSSDIFSKPVDVNKFGIIYAGAQKNMGPAGATLVIVKKDLIGSSKRNLPSMLDYAVHAKNGSMFNTPPVFAIYMIRETLKWIDGKGGVAKMAEYNQAKAQKLYNEIDSNPLFKGTAQIEDRSLMNVTFVMENPELEAGFLQAATEAGLSGLKGHRSVGGFRASIYNAIEQEGIDALIALMKEFARKHG